MIIPARSEGEGYNEGVSAGSAVPGGTASKVEVLLENVKRGRVSPFYFGAFSGTKSSHWWAKA